MRLGARFLAGLLTAGLSLGSGVGLAQSSATEAVLPPPQTFTAEQDHQNMMDQLGIKALRPWPERRRKSPEPCQLR